MILSANTGKPPCFTADGNSPPLRRNQATAFALTTLHMYSIIWSELKSGEVNMLLCKSPSTLLSRVEFQYFHMPQINIRADELFFLLTSCSHLPIGEPAPSKESKKPNHVNTPLKSMLRSHSCTYFFGVFLQKNRDMCTQNRLERAMDQHFYSPHRTIMRSDSERDRTPIVNPDRDPRVPSVRTCHRHTYSKKTTLASIIREIL